jgi:hypothetical protein
VPHDGGRQVEMRLIFSCAEVLETAHVLAVDLSSLCALGPTSFWVWTGGEKQAVGVAPSSGDRVQLEADDFINIFLLRIDLLYPPLMILLVYCHINNFQRASSVEKPWPGGENRKDGRASHHEAL